MSDISVITQSFNPSPPSGACLFTSLMLVFPLWAWELERGAKLPLNTQQSLPVNKSLGKVRGGEDAQGGQCYRNLQINPVWQSQLAKAWTGCYTWVSASMGLQGKEK